MILFPFIASTWRLPFECESVHIQKLGLFYLFVLILFIYFCEPLSLWDFGSDSVHP